MKRIFASALFCAAVFSHSALFAYTLSWNIKEGERVEVVKTASVKLFLNSMQAKSYRERNIVDLTCYGRNDAGANVKGIFSVFHCDAGSDIFRLESRTFSDFVIASDGMMTIPRAYTMPNLRQLPVFPKKDVAVNETWNGEAELVFTHLSKPLVMGIPVSYKLERVEKKNGHDVALISYDWSVRRSLSGMNFPDDFPLMISGKDRGFLWWDITDGRPGEASDEYRMAFLQPDGINTIEFQMGINTANRIYPVVSPEAGEKARAELEKDLGGRNGVTVASDPRGLVVRMGEVLFDFDSAALRKDTKSTLDLLVDTIKKKYPDREIIVEGHTDSTGDAKYNQTLSDRRAESVARYLSKGVGHDKFSYRGFAADKPISDNATEEGRRKNRRVEIVIKLN